MSSPVKSTTAKAEQQRKIRPPEQKGNASRQSGGEALFDLPLVGAKSLGQQADKLSRLPMTKQRAAITGVGRLQGNTHVQKLIKSVRPSPRPIVQPKFTVNEPGDAYEQEADRVADAVMRTQTAAPPPPPEDSDGPTDRLQRNGNGEDPPNVSDETASQINDMRGRGHPLPDGERRFFEERMGADFSQVRVHTGIDAVETSQHIQAKAYTTGHDIAFNEGEFQPGTTNGRHLIAHELTHVIQQGGAAEIQRRTIQRRQSPTEPSDLEGAEEPSDEEKSAAQSAASSASGQAANEAQTSTSEKAAHSAKSQANVAKSAPAKEKAAAAKAEGPLKANGALPQDQAAQQKKEATAEKSDSRQAAATDKTNVAAAAARNAAPQGAGAAVAEALPPAAPSGAGLEGATAAAEEKVEQAIASADQAPDKAPQSPQADSGFKATKTAGKAAATQQKEHPDAAGEAAEAQLAAEQPAAEIEGKAQANQVGEMEQAETPEFDKASFKQALMERIQAATPQSVEDADNFKANGKLDGVKEQVSGTVKQEQEGSQKPLDQTREAPPNTGAVEAKPTAPLQSSDPGPPPANIGAQAAVPKAKGSGEVETPMQESARAMDQQMADADITEEQLANSNEPEFQSALEQKQSAKQSVAEAPGQFRQEEQGQLQSAETEATATAQSKMQEMHSERTSVLGQTDAAQSETKSADEQKRAEVAAQMNRIYAETQAEVEGILSGLDSKVASVFDSGAAKAKETFENYVEQKMDAYKEKRYGGMFGWAKWAKDKLLGMPSEVNAFYSAGRQLYISEMDAVIDNVATIVSTTLTEAKAAVAKGKQRIKEYVDSLPQELQQVGQEAAQEIQSKFAALEQQISDKQSELIDTLAQKYQENLQAIDARIEEMKAANRGLVHAVIDAVGGVIKTILELKNMLTNVLARVADAVGKIIKDPIGFLGNLLEAVKLGFNQFIGNIETHLKKGLMGWLMGSIADAGIVLPETFDLKGIFQLVMQILGVSFDQIMGKLGKALGIDIMAIIEPIQQLMTIYQEEGLAGLASYGLEKLIGAENMEHLKSVMELFQIVQTGGLGALWEKVSEYMGNLKEMVMGQIQQFITERVIKAGITWLLSLFNPAGAFIKACKMIYDVVMFFIQRGSQIMSLVNAIIDSVGSIAAGNLSAAANFIEQSLAKAIPVAISFLSSLLGLGDISGKVREIIQRVRGMVDNALDKLFNSKPVQAVAGFIRKIVNKVKNLAQKGLSKAKEKLGIGKKTSSVIDEADQRIAETTDEPFESEDALHEKMATIKSDLKPRGLKDIVVKPQNDNPEAYDIIARQSKNQAKVTGGNLPPVGLEYDSLDSLGRAKGARGHILRAGGKDRESMPDIDQRGYLSEDHRGHLIGDRFGGAAIPENLVPMHSTVNLGSFKSFENKVADEYKKYKKKRVGFRVWMDIKPSYPSKNKSDDSSYRPSSISAKAEVIYNNKGNQVREEIADESFNNPKSAPREQIITLNLASADELYEAIPRIRKESAAKLEAALSKVSINKEADLEKLKKEGVASSTIELIKAKRSRNKLKYYEFE